MTGSRRRSGRMLVLAMGNDLLSDDGVALHAARLLRKVAPTSVDVRETGEAGFALLEFLEGYDRALILDAIETGNHEPGTLLRLTEEDFTALPSPSPHYAGLPDLRLLAERSGIRFPADVLILAMEVEDARSIGEQLTPKVSVELQTYVREADGILRDWVRGSD
ncbi:MAG: hydrogenase maturation protease [Bacteroidetes bacterium]|nr:hydrogenase maturation protease [Bacteroidota bacterium]